MTENEPPQNIRVAHADRPKNAWSTADNLTDVKPQQASSKCRLVVWAQCVIIPLHQGNGNESMNYSGLEQVVSKGRR